MQIHIDTIRATAVADGVGEVKLDRYYDMPDASGCRFIVRGFGSLHPKTYLIEIKRGKELLQRGRVRAMSTAIGNLESGGPRHQRYAIDLHPDQPIFPISDLVDKILEMGIKSWQISPVFDDALMDRVASHSSPQMTSDGNVASEDIPYDLYAGLLASRAFVVTGATWAIMSHDTSAISHIFLWMSAAKNAATIQQEIERRMTQMDVNA